MTADPESTTVTDQNAYLAERCREAWEGYTRLAKRRAALTNALKERLDTDTYHTVMEAIDADGAMSNAWAEATICEVARHMPMIAPSLPLIWEHCSDMGMKDQARCCVASPAGAATS